MDLKGERFIPQSREVVWQALNNIDILKVAIPGCEEISWAGENQLEAKVKAKVGPVNTTFKGQVSLENLNPPESYTLTGQGKGGAAGFAKGSANVHLKEQDGGTLLTYDVDVTVGGKLAQVGARLIQGTANKLSTQFFDTLTTELGGVVESASNKDAQNSTPQKLAPIVWASVVIGLVLFSLYYFS